VRHARCLRGLAVQRILVSLTPACLPVVTFLRRAAPLLRAASCPSRRTARPRQVPPPPPTHTPSRMALPPRFAVVAHSLYWLHRGPFLRHICMSPEERHLAQVSNPGTPAARAYLPRHAVPSAADRDLLRCMCRCSC
jgi:hypothetical protein